MSAARVCFLVLFPVLLVTLFGCGGGGGSSAPRTGRVEGIIYITDQGQNVVANGATVRVLGTSLTTRTDAHGHFAIDNVPSGSQTLIVSYIGYQSINLPVNIIPEQTTSVPENTTLDPADRKWTIMVFLNADNDLESYGVQDVNEMESVPDHDEIAVLVQIDRAPGYDATNGAWEETRRFLVRHDDNLQTMTSSETSPDLTNLGEVDMGDPEELRKFIVWGQQNYPAEHYMVIVWNHGSGWKYFTGSTKDVSFDDTTGTYIRTVELPAALQGAAPIDIVSFDASLMQMLEIAYEIRNTCDYVVGSEESPPGAGYPYQTWLTDLYNTPAMSPRNLGETMARQTRDYYGIDSDITHSVLDVQGLPALASAVDVFGASLIDVARTYASELASARWETQKYKFGEYKDLYHYAQLVKAKVGNLPVQNAADGVMQAVEQAVLAEYHGTKRPNSHGVSIYIPTSSSYQVYAESYRALDFYTVAPHWGQWLAAQQQ